MSPQPFISTRKSIKWGSSPAFENTSTLVLTTASKYFVDIRIFLPLPKNKLEWGFAGTASSTAASGSKPAHTVWTHWVDNKTMEEVRDEGDMWPRDDGSGEVVERGEMVNPERGVLEGYEEVWVDLEPGRVEGEEKLVSWTMKTDGEGGRGMLVRIGEHIQGVLRRGEEVSVGRWKWDGEWKLVVGLGELVLPVEGKMEVGERVKAGDGLEWEVVERFDWT